jgi:glycosyltransferase involved in cell wall biosynthesis
MRRAAIFVSPALYEPFGLGVLEAASSGCALVLADIPTFRELWDGAAVFADPRDAAALTQAIATLCRDSDLAADLQMKARTRATRYALDTAVNRYCALYRRLIGTAQPRAASLQEACA